MSWLCRSCASTNDDARRYCTTCGSSHGCPECHFLNEDGAEWCGGCGIRISKLQHDAVGAFLAEWNDPDAKLPRLLGYNLAEVLIESQIEENRLVRGASRIPVHMSQDELDDLFALDDPDSAGASS